MDFRIIKPGFKSWLCSNFREIQKLNEMIGDCITCNIVFKNIIDNVI